MVRKFLLKSFKKQIYSSEQGYCFNPLYPYSRQFQLKNGIAGTNIIWGKSIKESIIIHIKEFIENYKRIIKGFKRDKEREKERRKREKEIKRKKLNIMLKLFDLLIYDLLNRCWISYDTK